MKVNNTNFFQALEILIDQVQDIKTTLADSCHSPKTPVLQSTAALMHEPIDIDEVAKLTLKSVSTIYRLSSKGEIPCYKTGKRLYFFKDEIIAWIRGCKKKSYKDVLADAETYAREKRMRK